MKKNLRKSQMIIEGRGMCEVYVEDKPGGKHKVLGVVADVDLAEEEKKISKKKEKEE